VLCKERTYGEELASVAAGIRKKPRKSCTMGTGAYARGLGDGIGKKGGFSWGGKERSSLERGGYETGFDSSSRAGRKKRSFRKIEKRQNWVQSPGKEGT